MFPRPILIFLTCLMVWALSFGAAACGGDDDRADELAREVESLRLTATDKLRRSTTSTDNIISSASRGVAVPANETEAITELAEADLNSALLDLTLRDNALTELAALEIDEDYREYASLMNDSNHELASAIDKRLRIARLLGEDPLRLAGWDEIRAAEIVEQALELQQQEADSFNQAEQLRNQAEQIRDSGTADFGGY